MSERMTCPACGSYTSSVLNRYYEGKPCPECGLSAAAAAEIIHIQQTKADEALKTRLTDTIRERDEATQKLAEAERRLDRLADGMEELVRIVRQPLNKETTERFFGGG